MSHGLLLTVHGCFKRVQDRVTRRRRDYPGCQLAELLSQACALGIPSGLRLDIGGGGGQYRHILENGQSHVVGLDRFVGDQVDLIGDADHLPIQNGIASVAALVEVLEHLPDPARAMAECYRVLQPGGMVIITTPQYWHVHKHPGDYYRFTDDGLRMLCRRVGFEVVDCWSRGGPILILFHVIRVNLSERWRPLFVVPLYWLAERVDRLFYDPRPSGMHYDALGWSVLARKPLNSKKAAVS